MKKEYSNKDFGHDLKRAAKKKKTAFPMMSNRAAQGRAMAGNSTKLFGAPMPKGGMSSTPATANPSWVTQKGAKKKKVSNVIQKMCTKCKKSHAPGKHMMKGATKKKPLTTKGRKSLPSKDFAGPARSYPINDKNHARNALARVSQFGSPAVKARVRAAVGRKFPKIGGK